MGLNPVWNALTDRGKNPERLENEDSFYVPPKQGENMDSEFFLFAVADGMGGLSHGKMASQISINALKELITLPKQEFHPPKMPSWTNEYSNAVQSLIIETTQFLALNFAKKFGFSEQFQKQMAKELLISDPLKLFSLELSEKMINLLGHLLPQNMSLNKTGSSWFDLFSPHLTELIKKTNDYVYGARFCLDESNSEMGSTLVGIVIKENKGLVFNVGDSRLYHYSGKKLKQITKDHSKVRMLIDQGIITADGAKNHPDGHIVTRSLGTAPDRGVVKPDLFRLSLSPDDYILICSDGLTDMVEDEDIKRVLEGMEDSLETKAQNLIDAALKNGGWDNITLILIQMRLEKAIQETRGTPSKISESVKRESSEQKDKIQQEKVVEHPLTINQENKHG